MRKAREDRAAGGAERPTCPGCGKRMADDTCGCQGTPYVACPFCHAVNQAHEGICDHQIAHWHEDMDFREWPLSSPEPPDCVQIAGAFPPSDELVRYFGDLTYTVVEMYSGEGGIGPNFAVLLNELRFAPCVTSVSYTVECAMWYSENWVLFAEDPDAADEYIDDLIGRIAQGVERLEAAHGCETDTSQPFADG